jgi:predicted ArsR family transcriptional regulator
MSHIRRVVLETLSARGPLPVDAIAHVIRHSTMATRYHLALLLDEGLVVSKDVARRASAGRPQMLYALADCAHEHLPKQYNGLAARLLDEIGDSLGAKEKRALLRRAGRRLAAAAPALRRGARVHARLDRAVDFLVKHDYMARWEKTDGEFALCVCNCPYRQVALAHREVCDMDLALIGGLLDLPMQQTGCIAHQDSHCRFVVKPTRAMKNNYR